MNKFGQGIKTLQLFKILQTLEGGKLWKTPFCTTTFFFFFGGGGSNSLLIPFLSWADFIVCHLEYLFACHLYFREEICLSHHGKTMSYKNISSVEGQKGIIAIQRWSIENEKGAIAVQSLWREPPSGWFSMKHLWTAITPFWRSTDDMEIKLSTTCCHFDHPPLVIARFQILVKLSLI